MNEVRERDLLLDDSVEQAFRNFLRPWVRIGSLQMPEIRLDLMESNGDYRVKAEIPGVRKEDIQVEIDENQLRISVDWKQESDEANGPRLIRSERRYGHASRCVWLDKAVDRNKAKASYENGVLDLTLPKVKGSITTKLTID